MSAIGNIPVVDISKLLTKDDTSIGNSVLARDVATEIFDAFTKIGFVYIKNHGIPEYQIKDVFEASLDFFSQDIQTKTHYKMKEGQYHGWAPVQSERLNPERPGDLKETFSFIPQQDNNVWPKALQKTFPHFFDACKKVSFLILQCVALGLGIQDMHCFEKFHNNIGNEGSLTCLRSLYYPIIEKNQEILPGQLRLGEHADYGSITLLFQDDIGGLEVYNRDGDYIEATPIPGTIIVNIGDMMQRWSSNKLISNKHKVVIPKNELGSIVPRQSVAYFVMPDDNVPICCLDRSDMYESVTMKEYVNMKFSQVYQTSIVVTNIKPSLH